MTCAAPLYEHDHRRPMGAPDAPWYVCGRHHVINEFIAVSDVPATVVTAMGAGAQRYFHAARDGDGRPRILHSRGKRDSD
jgi:hypothetical protein